ncbi:DctP family TRAP transporter solute-binding subunit [Castellaniella sp. S9]|uniref:DctP family TRAP transporter solute-binding subunit n=1 Tax=Castellaniella sp. S9 TaxID=2993652 RepID=UPI0022B2F44D|nr:DctP family TRAP transporter solute-binding subunit [Castellaniella sp. S9]
MKQRLLLTLCLATFLSSQALAASEARFGNHYEPGHPNNRCGANPMVDAIAKAGVGLSAKVYPAAQLGTAPQMIEQLAIGELEIAMGSPSDLGVWHPPLSVMTAAYAFKDYDGVKQFVNSDIGQRLYDEVLKKANIRIIGTWLYGTRHLTANKPIRTPEDLAGQKIRVPDAPIMLANLQAMGGSPTPMAFGEVYLGLQQKVIDAQENPLPTIQSMKFYEEQDYLMLTGHVVETTLIMVAEPFWQSLNDDQRAALSKAADEATGAVAACIQDEEATIVDRWKASNTIEVIDVDRDAFRNRVIESFSKDDGRFVWTSIYRDLVQAQ